MPASTAPRFLVARRQKWLPVADRAHVSRLGMAGVVRPMGSSKHDQAKRLAEASVSASRRTARIMTPACSVTGSPSAPADRSWCSTGTRTRSCTTASDRTAAHRPAWAAFNRRARKAPGAVGIWHETSLVERAESIYSGMPVSGLAAATSSVPVARRGETAAERPGARQTGSVGAISARGDSGEKWSSGSLAQR
jgi:hypothetical protein